MNPAEIEVLAKAAAVLIGSPALVTFMWKGFKAFDRMNKAAEGFETLRKEFDLVVLGDGNGAYGVREARRRLEALGKKINEFQEMASGQHGFYSTFASIDAKLNQWATWRHDVIDKELNRLVLQIGRLEDRFEDLREEIRKG